MVNRICNKIDQIIKSTPPSSMNASQTVHNGDRTPPNTNSPNIITWDKSSSAWSLNNISGQKRKSHIDNTLTSTAKRTKLSTTNISTQSQISIPNNLIQEWWNMYCKSFVLCFMHCFVIYFCCAIYLVHLLIFDLYIIKKTDYVFVEVEKKSDI